MAVPAYAANLARRTQEALIPKRPPVFAGYDAAGWTHPASATGGDCFDLWKMPDGRLGLFLADASGHGLAPALIVSQARTIVRTLADGRAHPHDILGRANALHWSSAGHGPSLLRPACGQAVAPLEPPLQPLGVMSDWADVAPPPARIHPSGSLVLISDGVFEAGNPVGGQFGIARVIQILDDQPDTCTPGEIIAALRAAVRTWQSGAEAEDDQTLVVVQRRAADADVER